MGKGTSGECPLGAGQAYNSNRCLQFKSGHDMSFILLADEGQDIDLSTR
jgi:hypothetical protein